MTASGEEEKYEYELDEDYSEEYVDDDEEALDENEVKRVLMKVRKRVTPIVVLMYLLCYIDRANLSNVHLALQVDLQMSETAYGAAVGLFYAGYIFFEVPGNYLLKKIGCRIWLTRIMFSWGLITVCTMFVNSSIILMIVRFILGVAEAGNIVSLILLSNFFMCIKTGLYPGIVYYLTQWFTHEDQGKNIAFMMSSIPLSGVVSGSLAYVLAFMDGVAGLRWWKWFFLIEGSVTVLVSILVWFLLPNSPQEAKWLSTEELRLLEKRKRIEERSLPKTTAETSTFRKIFISGKNWLVGMIYFFNIVGVMGVIYFLPAIIHDLGFEGVLSNLLSVIPYMFAIPILLLTSMHSDKKKERIWHLFTAFSVDFIVLGLVVLFIQLKQSVLVLILTTFPIAAVLLGNTLIVALATKIVQGDKAIGIAMINSIAMGGGWFGPFMMGLLRDLTQTYISGVLFMMGAAAFATAGLLVLRRQEKPQDSSTADNAILLSNHN